MSNGIPSEMRAFARQYLRVTASVWIAQPRDKSRYGYLSEYDSVGQSQKEAGDYAEDIAAQMLASSLGIPFDIDKSWDEKRQQWTISGKIYKTSNINLHEATKTENGPRLLLQQYLCSRCVFLEHMLIR